MKIKVKVLTDACQLAAKGRQAAVERDQAMALYRAHHVAPWSDEDRDLMLGIEPTDVDEEADDGDAGTD